MLKANYLIKSVSFNKIIKSSTMKYFIGHFSPTQAWLDLNKEEWVAYVTNVNESLTIWHHSNLNNRIIELFATSALFFKEVDFEFFLTRNTRQLVSKLAIKPPFQHFVQADITGSELFNFNLKKICLVIL